MDLLLKDSANQSDVYLAIIRDLQICDLNEEICYFFHQIILQYRLRFVSMHMYYVLLRINRYDKIQSKKTSQFKLVKRCPKLFVTLLKTTNQ